jgi:A nuclease family of the HNH/ENDO VII superfamily with conserved AHH
MPFKYDGQWIKIGKLPSELARKWGLDSRKAYEFFFDGNRIKLRNSQGEIVTDKPSTAEEVLSLVLLGGRDITKKFRAEEEAIPGTSYLYLTGKGFDIHHVIPQSLHDHEFIRAVERAGRNINNNENYIPLPSNKDEANKLLQEIGHRLPYHDGYHNRYTRIVREKLNQEWQRLENSQLSGNNEAVLQRYSLLINRLKSVISNPPANVNSMDDFTEEHIRF